MSTIDNGVPHTEGIKSTALAPMKTAGFLMTPTTFEEAWRVAQVLSKTDFVPKDMRGRPESVLACLSMGAELGFSPMQSLCSIAVINGRPGLYGDGLIGVVRRDPSIVDITEAIEHGWGDKQPRDLDDALWDTFVARCTVRRERNGKIEETTRTYSVPQAKRAKLWKKRGRDGQDTPWITNPERMMQMRARGFALRDAAADITRGIGMIEELQDIEPRNVTPIGEHVPSETESPAMTEEIFARAAELGIKRAQIALEIKRDGAAIVLERLRNTLSAEAPTPDSPPVVVESSSPGGAAETGTGEGAESLPAVPPMEDKTKKRLFATLGKLGIHTKPKRLAFAADVECDGKPVLVHSYGELTEAQAQALIAHAQERINEVNPNAPLAAAECALCGVAAGQAHFANCENA